MPIGSLQQADSPRLDGANEEHVRLLAETEAALPPIIVHRATMRVIDGMHRVRAATLRGESTIEVQFYDGPEHDAFLVAVWANMAHGLPLSLADREAAAARIVGSHPWWSNKAIAGVTGLAASTVAAVRLRTGGDGQDGARVGRDGRTRPVDSVKGRIAASEIIAQRPGASLRQIAREAGISPTTARDVRERIRRGDDPVPPGCRVSGPARTSAVDRAGNSRRGAGPPDTPVPDARAILKGLSNDPSLRFTESGRALWRWLLPRAVGIDGWVDLADVVPPHCAYSLAKLARRCAGDWTALAEHLEEKTRMPA
ncbi:ParB N-terminal domain-containing protein [Micromonosporaceae bacterium B7E4]